MHAHGGAAGAGAGAAAAAAAAIAKAVKASGVIVRVESAEFEAVLGRVAEPLVVHATGGFFTPTHRYLTSYKGLAFWTKSGTPLPLPSGAEVVEAKKIWVPD